MTPFWQQLLLGLFIALGISALATLLHALSISGAVAAAILGTITFGLGGRDWAVLLLGFFITSTLLSRLLRKRKAALDEMFSKGSRRDAGQVLANGGVFGFCVLAGLAFPSSALPWLAGAATLAAVNADTWATELGVLSRRRPRLVTTWQPVERGTSGGVSPAGTLAALGGSFLIAILAAIFWPAYGVNINWVSIVLRLLVITLAGLLGALLDSTLGATVQAIYTCPQCNKQTERHPYHTCGTRTTLLRGWRCLNNDGVNAACALTGAVIALVCGRLFTQPLGLMYSPDLNGGITMDTLTITSEAFTEGQPVPARHTCSGEDLSPALQWSGIPSGTKSLALIVDDPDAPIGVFTHWVLYNLLPTLAGLPEGVTKSADLPGMGAQGVNDFRQTAYSGPCPPPGKVHHYHFKLYALDLEPCLPEGLTAGDLTRKMNGHILARGQLIGTFQR